MNIGNITFSWSYNCGSILQCMALRKVLKDKGHIVDVINFSTPQQQKIYSDWLPNTNARNIAKNILCIPGRSIIHSHYQQYHDYIAKQFNYQQPPMSTLRELNMQLPHYDALIAGGDQVWNVNVPDYSDAYFLNFAHDATRETYRFSYAPSLGATNINMADNKQHYAEMLSDFDSISCREPNGVRWLQELTGRTDIQLVLDPTLLLSAEDWDKEIIVQYSSDHDKMIDAALFDNNMKSYFEPELAYVAQPYIFYYAFSYSDENNQAIEQLASKLNLKVVVIDAKQWYIRRMDRYPHFCLSGTTGPDAFLNYMKNASYVITTSFHGTAFSVIFKKQFAYINLANHDPNDDRTSFLTDELGLQDRFITVEQLNEELMDKPIDYQMVDDKLHVLQQASLAYIDDNLYRAQQLADAAKRQKSANIAAKCMQIVNNRADKK